MVSKLIAILDGWWDKVLMADASRENFKFFFSGLSNSLTNSSEFFLRVSSVVERATTNGEHK